MQENFRMMQEGMTGTLMETLGIEMVEMTPYRVRARMPVTPKVHQPFGLLHGGASVALAETVASIGANLNCQDDQMAVGLEINANHIRSRRDGVVMAEALPLHVGRNTQVWEVRIVDETEKLVCISRCTLAVVSKTKD
ncbi:MAG TPA: hotdog fold thioesterase [Stenomitos sp.]